MHRLFIAVVSTGEMGVDSEGIEPLASKGARRVVLFCYSVGITGVDDGSNV